jgi:CubicO group peptidase (beta-lactamase class C family)
MRITLQRAFACVSVATIVALGGDAVSQTPTPSAKAIATRIQHELASAGVPGASFAVIAGTAAVDGTFGVADQERDVPTTHDTLFQVGSLNKLLTALALGITLDQRNIPYGDPLGKHVPRLSPRLSTVMFHQLLSQTSGLRDSPGTTGTPDETALGARVRGIGEADFVLPAGTVFSYSNLGYAAAGYVLEVLRAKPYADALAETLLTPLRMQRSTMRPARVQQQARAVGHRRVESGVSAVREVDNDTSLWPAGYLWSSAGELRALLSLLVLEGYQAYGVPPAPFRAATTPHAPMPNVFVGGHYGYGLMLTTDRGTRIYEHGGTQRGFSSILRVAPDRRLGIVILTNLDNAPLRRIAQTVMAEALALAPDTPVARKETAVAVQDVKTLLGVYRNRGTAELAVRDGRVVLILDEGAPMPLSRIGEDRYLARPKPDVAGLEFVLRPASGDVPAYLHFALWAYAR